MGKLKSTKKNRGYFLTKVKPIKTTNFVMNPVDFKMYLPNVKEFKVRRVYWITDFKTDAKSGQHAHKDEDGIFFVIKGKTDMVLDDGSGMKTFKLEKNSVVWVPKYIWHGLDKMSKDCIVIVLSDKYYDSERKSYIENYSEFRSIIENK